MTRFLSKIELFLLSLGIIYSEYKKVIKRGFEVTQEERSQIGYFLLIDGSTMVEPLSRVKNPFDSSIVVKIDFVDFLKPILQTEAFDIMTDNVSKKRGENDL